MYLLTAYSDQWIPDMPVVRKRRGNRWSWRVSGDTSDTLPRVSGLRSEADSQLRVQRTVQQLPTSKAHELVIISQEVRTYQTATMLRPRKVISNQLRYNVATNDTQISGISQTVLLESFFATLTMTETIIIVDEMKYRGIVYYVWRLTEAFLFVQRDNKKW